ncbi:putative leader peptide [Nocardioides ultimimeridianus]
MSLTMWNPGWVLGRSRPTVAVMPATLLTKRRAVDNCRVSSALCRMH